MLENKTSKNTQTENPVHKTEDKGSQSKEVQLADHREGTVQQRELQEITNKAANTQASTGPTPVESAGHESTVQRQVIQLQAEDDDVLDGGTLDQVVTRIEAIAHGTDTRGNLQDRITDLWKRQNVLLNEVRANLELQGQIDDTSETALALQSVVSSMSMKLAMLKMFLGQYVIPETIPYTSKVGTHLKGGGGGSEEDDRE